jgi:glycosyltransferase involved in cell wall biosynthesis
MPAYERARRGPDPRLVHAAVDELTQPAGVLHVRGWSLGEEADVVRVIASVNGVDRRMRLGLERPDIAARSDAVLAPVCGFEDMFDRADLGDAPWRILLRADLRDGSSHEIGAIHSTDDDALCGRLRTPERAARRPGGGGPVRRVLCFAHRLDVGGGQRYIVYLLARLAAEGVRLVVVSPMDGPLSADLRDAGVEVVIGPGAATSVEQLEADVSTVLAAVGGEFDAVIVNTLEAYLGAAVAEALDVPLVWAIHESYGFPKFWATGSISGVPIPEPSVRAKVHDWLANADATVFEAMATLELYAGLLDRRRAVVFPYGPDTESTDLSRVVDRRRDLRFALRISDNDVLLVCVGIIGSRKCQALLVQAFRHLVAEHPEVRLVLVGDGGNAYSQGLRQVIARGGLEDVCRIEELTIDATEWEVAADIVVCSSDNESLPLAIIESMHLAVCVVSTDVFGVPELIRDGENALLCTTRDALDLERALRESVRVGSAKRGALGMAGRRSVAAEHHAAACAAAWRRLLEDVVAGLCSRGVTS